MNDRFDSHAFRRALGQFATGVTIVSTIEPDGTPRGFTANSFTSVSLDPPLVLVCIANAASSCSVFRDAPNFSVNILAEDQKGASGLFATQRSDKFKAVDWHSGSSGVPVIDGAIAWFECSRYREIEAGDHMILVGRVSDFGFREGRPLGYLGGSYFTLGLEDPLVEAVGRGRSTILGAIFEQDHALLFEEDTKTQTLRLPAVGSEGETVTLKSLTEKFFGSELTTTIEFVYAVFEERSSGTMSIYYRGRASGPAIGGTSFIPFSEIPFERVVDPACRVMLQRYVDEALQGRFAVYMGDESEGVVRPVG